ncbi:MOSC N-terminal beta barrel domain-containing protein [Flagelloscypha sp. PMI_526]|nr:MOSC N-terminal beta barrel domain-containing protein [Flagelloscypha sp. PMI_526]
MSTYVQGLTAILIVVISIIFTLWPSRQSRIRNQGYGDVRVSKLLVHPIKSCRGTSVPFANYTPAGLENDRKWSIVDPIKKKVLTAREYPQMVLISPKIVMDDRLPHKGYLEISFPKASGCETFTIPLEPSAEVLRNWEILDDLNMWDKPIDGYICEALDPTVCSSPSEVISRFLGIPVKLVVKGPTPRPCSPTPAFPQLSATHVFQDGYPLLILSQESVQAVEDQTREYVGVSGVEEKWKNDEIAVERFRPNIVFSGGGPFCEDDWEEITIQSQEAASLSQSPPRFSVVSKCSRCLLPNVSPETGIPDKAVPFKVLAKFRIGVDPLNKYKPCLGDNACPLGNGVVRVGDIVRVTKLAPLVGKK